MLIIAPSILSANFAHLMDDVEKVQEAGAEWLHIDVMDNHFVPNLTIGPQVVADLKKESSLYFDVHLMTEKPESLIKPFAEAGADSITIHAESSVHTHRLLGMIKDRGIKAGIAYNPATAVSGLEYLWKDLDLVLLMSVNPGFGGQRFIPEVIPKIKKIAEMSKLNSKPLFIQVDGGINDNTALQVAAAGANVLVAGSYIFKSEDVKQAVRSLRKAAELDHMTL